MASISLTRKELRKITGRVNPVSQYRWFQKNGFTVLIRADGHLVVSRAHFESKMGGLLPGSKQQNYEPNLGAL